MRPLVSGRVRQQAIARSSLGRPCPSARHGAELVGELEQCEDSYRLCYVRGPEGIIVALAEPLS